MKTFFVDSFTTEPFKGNPAAVCFPETEPEETLMLQIAREIGFSETAFVRSRGADHVYNIRFFSPKQEIPLCGHATLAAARILFDMINAEKIEFITIENIRLVVERSGDSYVMAFPVRQTMPCDVPQVLLSALGIDRIKESRYSKENKIILLEIENAVVLKNLQPDFQALLASYDGINGVLVTAASGHDGYDYHYRYFWPWAGTNEDPVTGGVQTFLSVYWAERLKKNSMKAFQSSGRTGFMTVTVQNDQVLIAGNAVKMLEGEFMP